MQKTCDAVWHEKGTAMSTKVRRGRPKDPIGEELRRVGAQKRVADFRERQKIVEAAMAGVNQNVIAESLEVSQPHISRLLAAVKRQNAGALREIPRTALDIITERDAGVINDEQMMQALKELDYTDGHVPKVNGVATDAYVRGSWDDIEFAFQRDRLTFDQYSELFAARRDRQRNAASDAG